MKSKKFSLTLTKGVGVRCIWEEGGSRGPEGGFATIIAGQFAEKPRAIYIPRIPTPFFRHGLIQIKPGYFIIEASDDGAAAIVDIWRVTEMTEKEALAEKIQEYCDGEWSETYCSLDEDTDHNLYDAADAAMKKCSDPYCSSVFYALQPRHYLDDLPVPNAMNSNITKPSELEGKEEWIWDRRYAIADYLKKRAEEDLKRLTVL